MKNIGLWLVILLVVGWVYSNSLFAAHPVPPSPTPTSLPGYVAGEETEAYASFIQYYDKEIDECHDGPNDYGQPDYGYSVDKKYSGKAVYVGAGIWRFYIQVKTEELIEYDPPAPTYKEDMIEVQSLSDRTWPNICNPYDPKQDQAEQDYEPDNSSDPVEPPDPSWP